MGEGTRKERSRSGRSTPFPGTTANRKSRAVSLPPAPTHDPKSAEASLRPKKAHPPPKNPALPKVRSLSLNTPPGVPVPANPPWHRSFPDHPNALSSPAIPRGLPQPARPKTFFFVPLHQEKAGCQRLPQEISCHPQSPPPRHTSNRGAALMKKSPQPPIILPNQRRHHDFPSECQKAQPLPLPRAPSMASGLPI